VESKEGESVMSHTLENCELTSTEYFDECELCGELTACICLGSIVDEWQIENTGIEGSFAFRYQYKEKGSLVARFGYADTYREAMDAIAHGAQCEKAGA
jgi:hypothetical protein